MYYVELLRAKRVLIVAGIILGIIFLIAAILRIAFGGERVSDWPMVYQSSPTARVTHSTLADGSERTVVDDPAKREHAVITKRRDGSLVIDVTEPTTERSRASHDHLSMGSVTINERDYANGSMRQTHITYRPADMTFDVGILFLVSLPMGLLVATMLGGVPAKENDGHLELAWTKPVSRERYALAAFAVDALAIVASQLASIAVILLCALLFAVPSLTAGENTAWRVLFALLGSLAWYALLNAASASLKRGPGLVLGLGWVFAVMIPSFAAAFRSAAGYNTIAAAIYAIFRAISYLDPIAYFSLTGRGNHLVSVMGVSAATTVGIFAAMILAYSVLAVLQWRRVEA